MGFLREEDLRKISRSRPEGSPPAAPRRSPFSLPVAAWISSGIEFGSRRPSKKRFLSHHDLMRLFERALRRRGLPLRMTEGHNPDPVVAFPTALGLGIESLDEILEFELTGWTFPGQLEKLSASSSPRSSASPPPTPSTASSALRPLCGVRSGLPGQLEGLVERIRAFLALKECPVERVSDKDPDGRALPGTSWRSTRKASALSPIGITDQGTAKPEEVLRSIGIRVDETVRLKKTFTELAVRR